MEVLIKVTTGHFQNIYGQLGSQNQLSALNSLRNSLIAKTEDDIIKRFGSH